MKISEKSNGRILEKWLKFPSSHSDQRNRLLNSTPAFFRRFKDLEPMLIKGCLCSQRDAAEYLQSHIDENIKETFLRNVCWSGQTDPASHTTTKRKIWL